MARPGRPKKNQTIEEKNIEIRENKKNKLNKKEKSIDEKIKEVQKADKKEYYIVDKRILPSSIKNVLLVNDLVQNEKMSKYEAIKKVGLSRSTYYKYKDFVFLPSDKSHGRKALISITLEHTQGSLSNVLNYISSVNGNILTINQNMPMNDAATVIILMEVLHFTISIEETIEGIKRLSNVINCKLMSIE